MQTKEIIERFRKAQDSLVVQQSDFSLAAINEMVRKESIDIIPHYQRRDRWNQDKQSALIESFILNVPVPPVYLSEDEYGHYSVIDGKQRITAICDFLGGSLKLKGLKKFPELDGLTFNQLPAPLQNALTVRPYIRVTTLLKQSDSDLKYEVFLRLNTGGDRLTAQEIRNVAFSGPLNDLLFELSEHDFLKDRLKIEGPKSSAYRSMEDVEHVLRFFTVRDVWTNMRHPLGEEMDLFMERNRTPNIDELRNLFICAITACEWLWGEHAFHKPTQGGWRTQLISPLYDAQMVAASMMMPLQLDFARQSHDRVISATRELFENDLIFVKAVTQSTNNASSVRKRVTAFKDLLECSLGC